MDASQRRMKALATEIIERGFRVPVRIPKSPPVSAEEQERRAEQLRDALTWPGERPSERSCCGTLPGSRHRATCAVSLARDRLL